MLCRASVTESFYNLHTAVERVDLREFIALFVCLFLYVIHSSIHPFKLNMELVLG